jgi:hypothetical protein
MSAVFSAWSVPRIYNGSVFAVEMRLIEYILVPCSTETGELELENWAGIPR